MPLTETPYLHGMDGSVSVAGDGETYHELDATSWEGNPFEVDQHVFATFRSGGANRAMGGLASGREVTITVKGRKDEDIRAADMNLIEGKVIPTELCEPGMAKGQGHKGNLLIRSVFARVVTNAEMEYRIQGTSDGHWTRGTRTVDTVPGGGGED